MESLVPKSRGLGFESGLGMLLMEGLGSENDMGRSIKVPVHFDLRKLILIS